MTSLWNGSGFETVAAYGRAESVVFGRQGADQAIDRIVAGAAEARAAIRSARAAAAVPAAG